MRDCSFLEATERKHKKVTSGGPYDSAQKNKMIL